MNLISLNTDLQLTVKYDKIVCVDEAFYCILKGFTVSLSPSLQSLVNLHTARYLGQYQSTVDECN